MSETYIRVHRLVDTLSEAPIGSDQALDGVSRKLATYMAQGMESFASGNRPKPPSLATTDLKALLAPDYPGAEIVSADGGVWFWMIDENGHRHLVCTESEVVLTQVKDGATVTALDPPIGVRVEEEMGEFEYDA